MSKKNRFFSEGGTATGLALGDIHLLAMRMQGHAESDAEYIMRPLPGMPVPRSYSVDGAWDRLEKAGLYHDHAATELGKACVAAWQDRRVFMSGEKLYWVRA